MWKEVGKEILTGMCFYVQYIQVGQLDMQK